MANDAVVEAEEECISATTRLAGAFNTLELENLAEKRESEKVRVGTRGLVSGS
jgi:hypothetical protein